MRTVIEKNLIARLSMGIFCLVFLGWAQGATAKNVPPKVSLTAPANNTSYTAPANIILKAKASDSDGTIAKVKFYANGNRIGTDTKAPYSITWSNVPEGSYTLTAKATDNLGASTTSTPITITVNASPTVTLAANPTSAIAPATITLNATAADPDGTLSKVEFFQGATLIATATSAPYIFNVTNVGVGNYSFTARATDNLGAVTTSSAINVTVKANQSPTVTLGATPTNAIAPVTIIITATANDTDGTIAKVEFYEGTNLLTTLNSAPYIFNWTNVQAGSYTLFAKAYDDRNAVTTSSAVNVTVNPNQPPSVTLTSPNNNATYTAPATITLAANANDTDGSIAKVEFLNGASVIATTTTPPYTFDFTNVSVGSYTLTARATDDKGVMTTSDPVMVSVTPGQVQVFYIYTDQLNTPRVITDQTNKVVWRWDNQDPFGANVPDDDPDGDGIKFTCNLRFPGQYADRETGMNYNYFRDYDPSSGRYIESDPIGLRGGISTYAYVYDNPLNFTDPHGLETYQCIRPLGGKPGGYVSPGNATHHQYSCVVLPNGESKCGGLGPSGSVIRSPGKPTSPEEDYFKAEACTKTQDDNSCFEQCLQDEWQKPRPTYSVIWGLGTQCQEYDDDVNLRCRKKCNLK